MTVFTVDLYTRTPNQFCALYFAASYQNAQAINITGAREREKEKLRRNMYE